VVGRGLLDVDRSRRQNSIESNDQQHATPVPGGVRKNVSFSRPGHSRMTSARESKARHVHNNNNNNNNIQRYNAVAFRGSFIEEDDDVSG